MTTENQDHIETTTTTTASTVDVLAPVTGAVVALDAVPDPVFSSGALGRGAAVQPTDGLVLAPIAGEVVTVMPHAYGIAGGGVEVLVHVGIDTVELQGAHFAPVVAIGDTVGAGQPLGTADLVAIDAAGYRTVVIVAVTNTAALADVKPTVRDAVTAGDALLTITL